MFSPILAQSSSGFPFISFNTVLYTVSFLVPGFLIDFTAPRIFYQKSDQVQITLLKFLVLSCLNYAVWIPICFLIFNKQISENSRAFLGNTWVFLGEESPLVLFYAFLLVIFISPIFLGLLLRYVSKEGLIERQLSKLGLQTLKESSSAWDYKFGLTRETLWILVTLKDGSTIAGKFGTNSLASPVERDLYIEEVYRIMGGDEPWQSVPQNSGIWIRGEEICYIEFWE